MFVLFFLPTFSSGMTFKNDWDVEYRWKRSSTNETNVQIFIDNNSTSGGSSTATTVTTTAAAAAAANVNHQWSNIQSVTYIVVPLLCVFLCTVATIINARILFCVRWIRRPLSPTLYISLSLALADTCSAILVTLQNYLSVFLHPSPSQPSFFFFNFQIGLGFIFNSLLPKGLNVNVDNDCLFLILEAFRLSGILISTTHLLVLAGNHYFGILCPFRSMRWLTHTNLTVVVVFIWIAPTAYIFGYFGSFKNQGFQRDDCQIE